MFLVQTRRHSEWHTVDRAFDIEEAFDRADILCRSMFREIRVFEPMTRATYYVAELKEIVIHGLKIRKNHV